MAELWDIAKPFGRPRKFKNAEELWTAFRKYVQWNNDNPMTVFDARVQTKSDRRGDTKRQAYNQVQRPMSLTGFRLHAGIKSDWSDFKIDYEKRGRDFIAVIHTIEKSVRQQMVDQALVGNYKENLVARIHGIGDKVTQDVKVEAKADIQLTPEQARNRLKELEAEI